MNNCKAKDMFLYAVTDSAWLNGEKLADQVEAAILGGTTFVQIREKEMAEEAFEAEAIEVRDVCRKYGVPFVVNDNVDLALRINADGVHVGQSDMEAGSVRAKLGPDKIIGVSCKTVEQAQKAVENGADYLGVGAMFATGTKSDATVVTKEALSAITAAVEIPVVAIGGIKLENLDYIQGTGIDGVAVVSAIFAKPDKTEASKALCEKLRSIGVGV